jgi:hypothetical protein
VKTKGRNRIAVYPISNLASKWSLIEYENDVFEQAKGDLKEELILVVDRMEVGLVGLRVN